MDLDSFVPEIITNMLEKMGNSASNFHHLFGMVGTFMLVYKIPFKYGFIMFSYTHARIKNCSLGQYLLEVKPGDLPNRTIMFNHFYLPVYKMIELKASEPASIKPNERMCYKPA